tara:strand:- start:58 stop:432 length:375 start_codon:yes stop_codon:yes gene_type:complete
MKRSFLLIIPFIISGCRFGSFYEANISCEEWKDQGGIYTGIIQAIKRNDSNKNSPDYLFKDTKNTFPMRRCEFDKETKQILGLDLKNREENKKYYLPQSQRLKDSPNNLLDLDLDWEVVKRFRY